MKINKTINKINDLYTKNINQHGVSSKSVGWPTKESQDLRFDVLNEVINKNDIEISVNDYGCGFGSHLINLLNSGHLIKSYNGYDISEKMLLQAKKELKNCETEINLINDSEIVTMADYSFVSGTFNVRFDNSDDSWIKFIKEKLDQIDRFSAKGFSFNLLSTYVDFKDPNLFYSDPCFWFDYCKKNFSRRVALIHDYPLYEWTIVVRK